jgi:hypothetical protein
MTKPFDSLKMTRHNVAVNPASIGDFHGRYSEQDKGDCNAAPSLNKEREMAAEVVEPTTTSRKGIELASKVEAPKKAKAAAAKPRKTATKKENVVAISQPKVVSREIIEQVAYQICVQRGYQHGYALEDWIRAERELLERAS